MCRGTRVPDGDGHSLTCADGRPRVDVAGEILVGSLKSERSALRCALQEVTTHDGPVPEPRAPEISFRLSWAHGCPETAFGSSNRTPGEPVGCTSKSRAFIGSNLYEEIAGYSTEPEGRGFECLRARHPFQQFVRRSVSAGPENLPTACLQFIRDELSYRVTSCPPDQRSA